MYEEAKPFEVKYLCGLGSLETLNSHCVVLASSEEAVVINRMGPGASGLLDE